MTRDEYDLRYEQFQYISILKHGTYEPKVDSSQPQSVHKLGK